MRPSIPASGEAKSDRKVTKEYRRPRSAASAPHAALAWSGTCQHHVHGPVSEAMALGVACVEALGEALRRDEGVMIE